MALVPDELQGWPSVSPTNWNRCHAESGPLALRPMPRALSCTYHPADGGGDRWSG